MPQDCDDWPLVLTRISPVISFSAQFIFSSWNLVNAIVAFLFVYETKDLTLEKINMMYNDPNCKPWTSRAWVPPGMTSRDDIKAEVARHHDDVLAKKHGDGTWHSADDEEPQTPEEKKAEEQQNSVLTPATEATQEA